MNPQDKKAVIGALLEARRPDLANAVSRMTTAATLVEVKQKVQGLQDEAKKIQQHIKLFDQEIDGLIGLTQDVRGGGLRESENLKFIRDKQIKPLKEYVERAALVFRRYVKTLLSEIQQDLK